MPRLYFILSIFMIASLLSGCAGRPANAKSIEDYRMATDVPTKPELTGTSQTEIVSRTPPKDCPVTVPQEPSFIPPAPYSKLGWEGYFWDGSNSLWVSLPVDGVWWGLPHNPEGYSQKIPWWREGYVWTEEPQPDLTMTGERLDAKAPLLKTYPASNAYSEDMGSAIMTGVDFPTLGCWKITGKYKDAELSFVVWVAP